MDPSSIEELRAATGGRYDIEGFLAEGGMGAVYTARNRALGSRVAIKVLPPEAASSTVRMARFKREAALAANLSHPHIVPVFEFDATQGLAYLIMPFVEGDTLADCLDRGEGLDYPAVHELIRQIAGALGFAHKRDVVHRDIKPANILRDDATGRWLLTDFGISHVTHAEDTEITRTGVIIGTPAYMAPEQRLGVEVDNRSDLYSLAVVAYQALCRVPIDRLGSHLTRSTAELEQNIRKSTPGISAARARTLAWPLAVERENRPASAGEWLEALEVEERKRLSLRWLGLVALCVAAIVTGWLLLRPNEGTITSQLPTVAVLPFQIDVGRDTNNLAMVLPQAFDWQLQYLPDHRVLGADVRNEIAARYGSDEAPTDTLFAIAHRRGATLTVQGRVTSRGDTLTISVMVKNPATGDLIADADSSGPVDSLDALVSGIVVKTFAERLAREITGWSSSLPRGLDAINAFVLGDRDFRRGGYASAVERFDEVIRLDSTFAPAHFKRMLSLMLGLRPTQYSTQLWSAFEAASEFREGLDPVSHQLLASYETLLREGDVHGAESALQGIVTRYPRAAEAWYLLGYVQFNLRALLGTSVAEAGLAFRRSVDRDSSFATALWHLALIAGMEGDEDAARDYLDRFLAVDSTSYPAELARTYDSLLYRGLGATNHVLGSLDDRPTRVLEVLSLGAGELRPPPGVRPIAREALRAFWQNAGTQEERRVAFRMQLAYLLARGRYASADSLFGQATRMRVPRDELDRWILLSAISPLPDLAGPAGQAAAVSRLRGAEEEVAEALWLIIRWLQTHRRGEAESFQRTLREIVEDPTAATPLARSLLMDLDARRSLSTGDTAAALATWETATGRHSVDKLMFGLTASLWPVRLDWANVASASGQQETAIGITSTFEHMAAFTDQVAWPSIILLRAETSNANNDVGTAVRAYEELIELLEDANGDGLSLLEDALNALAELDPANELVQQG